MKSLVIVIISVLLLVVLLIAITLFNNKARLFDRPGFSQRLAVYLTQNRAETTADHAFPELRTPLFNTEPESLYRVVISVAGELGWHIEHQDDDNLKAHLVVTTPLLGFQDDVRVQVILENSGVDGTGSSLWLSSASRVGKADFAANAGHIQTLVAAVKTRVRKDAIQLFEQYER